MKYYLFFLLIILLFTTFACSKNGLVIEFSQQELQQELVKFFPMNPVPEDKEKSKFDLTLSNPSINLQEGNDKIGLSVNIEVEASQELLSTLAKPMEEVSKSEKQVSSLIPKLSTKDSSSKDSQEKLPIPTKFTGSVNIVASISYDQKAKGIHLSDSKISNLNIEKLPAFLVKDVTQIAEKTLSQKFKEKPIPLKTETDLEKFASSFLKSVTVKDGKLLVELGW